jgi:uncharacterized protein YoxC
MIASVGDIIRNILFIVLIIFIPILSIFAVRLLLKLARSFENLNQTLDDARPQLNMLLANLNTTVEDMNGELGKVIDLTTEVQDMINRLDSSIQTLDVAMKSPALRYGGMAAGMLTTSMLVRSRSKKSMKKAGKRKKKE